MARLTSYRDSHVLPVALLLCFYKLEQKAQSDCGPEPPQPKFQESAARIRPTDPKVAGPGDVALVVCQRSEQFHRRQNLCKALAPELRFCTGTQKIDGFFASFRRVVGRLLFNTVGPSSEKKAPRMEQLMHFHVRLFQLKHPSSFHRDAPRQRGRNRQAAVDPERPPMLTGQRTCAQHEWVYCVPAHELETLAPDCLGTPPKSSACSVKTQLPQHYPGLGHGRGGLMLSCLRRPIKGTHSRCRRRRYEPRISDAAS